ncbi:MAG: energy transducer TonB [Alistipes sp.]|nr:energy transducer TonB [Alistipes sp.]
MSQNQDSKKATNRTSEDAPRPPRRPRLRLPFDNRSEDIGSWAYDHRIGLCVMIILYLLIGIGFFASKIVIGRKVTQQGMFIDLQELAALEQERDRLAEEVRRANQNIDWSKIRNTSSNENALNENLADDRGTNTSSLNEDAQAVEQRMRANREAYEKGLSDAKRAGERQEDEGVDDSSGNKSDKKVKGSVTVSFSFDNPVRYSRKLIKPAYRCEGGGEVVVKVAIDRAGKVLYAYVESGGDECMRNTAVSAAKGSRFDHNNSAPAKQEGTITYIFIPQ